ncbi:hypothetical protein [Paenibacillus aestuarii]|uniref:Uncharacterized protein n=1 Tax=Paenibacillus aestuarii TaxID=516965 RepID=A0ABW0K7P6_9BACL|nr:hypothetical protein [Paenibacillus aestuarii]
MKVWKKAYPHPAIRVVADEVFLYKNCVNIYASEDDKQDELVAKVYGTVAKTGKLEARVRYEQDTYEEYKANLLIQRAVREAMEMVKRDLLTRT